MSQTDNLIRVKSGISQAYWCDNTNTLAEFRLAEIAFDTTKAQNLSWFDKLFEGGLMLPDSEGEELHPLTMLVSGPPGSGKTTLVSELCYRLAVNEQGNKRPLSTLYISTDAGTGRMIHNAIDLGWDKAEDYFIPFDPEDKNPRLKHGMRSMIGVWGQEKFLKTIKEKDILSAMIKTAITSLDQWVLKADTKDFMTRLKYKIGTGPIEEGIQQYFPDILVIDSLNILDQDKQIEFFQSFVDACKATKLVIYILNTGANSQDHKLWEYFCDTVIRLDSEYVHDYYVRTIEVVKARFQSHQWGKHQLKIYANPKGIDKPDESDVKKIQEYNTAMRRAHPYRPTGGVFIFPSIHSYLSVYKRKTASETSRVHTYPEKLNEILQIPKGRCTAFIGERGGHKSHLAYLHMLNRLLKHEGESGLIISLREDESTTIKTLAGIAQEEFGCGRDAFDCLEKDNHLEILYFPPGYITPEEFFHRIFISVHQLKKRNSSLTVMFNSLDQISARFPLCAKQEIFIPGIIQTLSGEGATSICIAVDEPGQPIQQYGLLPMADLIVSFSLRRFATQDYYSQLKKSWQDEINKDQAYKKKFDHLQTNATFTPDLKHEAVVLQVVRFSGGERAGKRGILELVNQPELDKFPYSKAGLQFTPLSEELTQGEFITQCK